MRHSGLHNQAAMFSFEYTFVELVDDFFGFTTCASDVDRSLKYGAPAHVFACDDGTFVSEVTESTYPSATASERGAITGEYLTETFSEAEEVGVMVINTAARGMYVSDLTMVKGRGVLEDPTVTLTEVLNDGLTRETFKTSSLQQVEVKKNTTEQKEEAVRRETMKTLPLQQVKNDATEPTEEVAELESVDHWPPRRGKVEIVNQIKEVAEVESAWKRQQNTKKRNKTEECFRQFHLRGDLLKAKLGEQANKLLEREKRKGEKRVQEILTKNMQLALEAPSA